MTEKTRADYTWDDATHDLALTTSLTLRQAIHVTYALQTQGTAVHPYDALPHLTRLFSDDPELQAGALAALIRLANP